MKLQHALMALLLLAPEAFAGEVTFYRCTDATGALTVQNMPCPKGNQQEKRVMQSVGSVPMGKPAPAARPAVVPPPVTAVTPTTPPVPGKLVVPAPRMIMESGTESDKTDADAKAEVDTKRLPPPVLFQCTTYDKDSYITESEEPQSRCVAMSTVGLDGNPQLGAGEACEVMRDQCARVADGALCEAWKKRMDETEVAARFARAENVDKNKAEFERAQKIYNESTCGK